MKNKKWSGTSLPASYFAWFLKKNVSPITFWPNFMTGCLYFVRYWAIFQHNSRMVVFSARCFFMVAFQDFVLKKFTCWTFPLIFRPKFLYDCYYYYFSICVFFHNHSRIAGLQGKGEGISLTPHYRFHPLHRHLDISRTITAESSLLHIGSSRTRTENL